MFHVKQGGLCGRLFYYNLFLLLAKRKAYRANWQLHRGALLAFFILCCLDMGHPFYRSFACAGCLEDRPNIVFVLRAGIANTAAYRELLKKKCSGIQTINGLASIYFTI